MQVTKSQIDPTKIKLTIVMDADELQHAKEATLKHLATHTKIQGFRQGKAPLALVEKAVDQAQLQSEFLEHAINDAYPQAVEQANARPVGQPQIEIVKFVPFTTLEVIAEVESVGEVGLPDYKKIASEITKKKVSVTAKQVDDVIKDLQSRAAERQSVDRAAKDNDEVVIDFKGADTKTKEALPGTEGSDYPLKLGSGTFIPGFEEAVVGMKAGEVKDFDVTFPADYGAKNMQGRKVTFTVTAKSVNDLVEPKADDAFAKTVGPFKSLTELKDDIKRQLTDQATRDIENQFESDIVEAVAKKTKVTIPQQLIDDEIQRLEEQERQNLMYQGMTWQEHLTAEGVTEEEHRERNREGAELRVKSGLLLGEIAEAEKITVTPEELEIRVQLLKGQYATDEQMQSELDKPENRRDIMNRLMTEKTLDKLKTFAAKK